MATKGYGILTIMVFWVSNSVKFPASWSYSLDSLGLNFFIVQNILLGLNSGYLKLDPKFKVSRS